MEKLTLEAIYHQYKKLVFNLALQYVQQSEDAQEITQDVFLAVHQSLADFKGASKMSTWIYRITINKSLDFIKAKRRKKRFAQIISLFQTEGLGTKYDPVSFDHPGVLLEQKESLGKLFQWINELPDNQRTTIILAKIEQKSQSEIAEIMNLSTKAVESLLQRAKGNLLRKIKQSEGKLK